MALYYCSVWKPISELWIRRLVDAPDAPTARRLFGGAAGLGGRKNGVCVREATEYEVTRWEAEPGQRPGMLTADERIAVSRWVGRGPRGRAYGSEV